TRLDDLGQVPSRGVRDVHERPERARREQRVADAPLDVRATGALVAEPPQERCLADTRLTADEHQAPARARPDRVQGVAEHGQLALALEQLAVALELGRHRDATGPVLSTVMPAPSMPRCEFTYRRDPSGENTGPVTSDPSCPANWRNGTAVQSTPDRTSCTSW